MAEALRQLPVELPDGTTMAARDVLGADDPGFAGMAASLRDHDAEFLTAILERCHETHRALDPEVLLPAVRCALLLLQGDPAAGGLLADHEIELARLLLPGVDATRIAGVGHALHTERPDTVAEALRDFLEVSAP